MQQHRFFVAPELLAQEPIPLEGDLAHQLSRVLRLSRGDLIELLDNSGSAWLVRLEEVTHRLCLATRVDTYQPPTEPRVRMILHQALPKARKMDWVLQKCTELGVSCAIPMVTARTVASERGEKEGLRSARWKRILQEAAEQSGRARIPELAAPETLADSLARIEPGELCLMGAFSEGTRPIRSVLQALSAEPDTVRLYVGPEGGFDPAEEQQASAAGVLPVSLGPRVLRTETAGVVLLALVGYTLGEMDTVAKDVPY